MGGEKRDHSRQAKRLQLPMVILNPVDYVRPVDR